MELLKILRSRSLLKDATAIPENLINSSVYCGFDPTAESLHVGHLSTFNALVLSSIAGLKPIALLGGATALIGDPSGRTQARAQLENAQIEHNTKCIEKQISKVYEGLVSRALHHKLLNTKLPLTVLNNANFYQDMSLIKFLREVGYYFPINPLINRDFVKNREDSITYTEFSYSLMQAYDFYYLCNNHNCMIQLGGSDQWYNITTGTELIRKKLDKSAAGVTLPLLLTADGQKFGKSAGNALFLDENLTSPYLIYQYCFNLPDVGIKDLLLRLTFVSEEEINETMSKPLEQRECQKLLAKEIIAAVHGEDKFHKVKKASDTLYRRNYRDLKSEEIDMVFQDAIKFEVTSEETNENLLELLARIKVTENLWAITRLFKDKALRINGDLVTEEKSKLSDFSPIDGKYFIVHTGRRKVSIIIIK
ncbi:TYRS [Blepharisma stoltei]|uniref:Tyrosine--tRNA ligase n=1 Tax=Blepharisma stoltei TaxID=1481888 RepID=A0AAU9JSE3_9CILI|nr:unnamed protein product [Blepharisma stoltei]